MMTETVTWKTTDGRTAEVIVALKPALTINGDERRDGALRIDILAKVGGVCVGYELTTRGVTGAAVARIGKLGMTSANYDRVRQAVASVEQDPAWRAYEERVERGIKVVEQHHADAVMLDRAMTLGGRSL